ncbi:hypothetical protein [Nocardioides jiangxiensis]|uniref:Uncharacterized protein n=1 Tax=Nocardioides jiangxiensis TaxID=3064524 RepID=A0ABT9B4T1_9ACTN|nr:hypothetical protein [Nocardioides sp. WY-20]MDO7868158.1 hypothetical protein [Nocardioides sp. WY-20]
MTDDTYLAEILKNPTQCHEPGCAAENGLLMHLTDNPWGGADYCYPHARRALASTPLVLTCECTFCVRARHVLSRHEHEEAGADAVLCRECRGRHVITTASGTRHLVDLTLRVAMRVQDESNPLVSHGDPEYRSASMRRDGQVLPLLDLEPVVLGQPAYLLLGEVDDYEGYGCTTRLTTPVVSVEVVG